MEKSIPKPWVIPQKLCRFHWQGWRGKMRKTKPEEKKTPCWSHGVILTGDRWRLGKNPSLIGTCQFAGNCHAGHNYSAETSRCTSFQLMLEVKNIFPKLTSCLCGCVFIYPCSRYWRQKWEDHVWPLSLQQWQEETWSITTVEAEGIKRRGTDSYITQQTCNYLCVR